MRGLLRAGPFGGNLFEYGVISGLGLVGAIKRKCRPACAVGMGADPRVLVGESPGLDCSAARILKARPHYAAIDLGLAKKIAALCLASSVM